METHWIEMRRWIMLMYLNSHVLLQYCLFNDQTATCSFPRFIQGGEGPWWCVCADAPEAEGPDWVHRAGHPETGAPKLWGHPLYPPLWTEVRPEPLQIRTEYNARVLTIPTDHNARVLIKHTGQSMNGSPLQWSPLNKIWDCHLCVKCVEGTYSIFVFL